jgi:hypothetical protein
LRTQAAQQGNQLSEFMEDYARLQAKLAAIQAKDAAKRLIDKSTEAGKESKPFVTMSQMIFMCAEDTSRNEIMDGPKPQRRWKTSRDSEGE